MRRSTSTAKNEPMSHIHHETVPPNQSSRCPQGGAHELADGHEEGELVAHELHVSLRAVLQGDAVGRVVY